MLFKDICDGLDRITAFKLDGKWMSDEVYSGLDFILLQGRLKDGFKDKRFRVGSHILGGGGLYSKEELIRYMEDRGGTGM